MVIGVERVHIDCRVESGIDFLFVMVVRYVACMSIEVGPPSPSLLLLLLLLPLLLLLLLL